MIREENAGLTDVLRLRAARFLAAYVRLGAVEENLFACQKAYDAQVLACESKR